MEAHERLIDGKFVGKGAQPTGLKKGGHDRSTSPYHLPMAVPPPLPPYQYFTSVILTVQSNVDDDSVAHQNKLSPLWFCLELLCILHKT